MIWWVSAVVLVCQQGRSSARAKVWSWRKLKGPASGSLSSAGALVKSMLDLRIRGVVPVLNLRRFTPRSRSQSLSEMDGWSP